MPTLHLFRHLNGLPGSDLHMSVSLGDEPCKVPYGRFKGFIVVIAQSADMSGPLIPKISSGAPNTSLVCLC